MALPPNLATNDIISEAWVDAVVDSFNAVPRLLGYNSSMPATVFNATKQDLPGVILINPVAGHRYQLQALANIAQVGAAGTVNLYIADAAGTNMGAPATTVGNGQYVVLFNTIFIPAPAVPTNYKLQLATSAGTCTLLTPFYFSIIDWGA